jgi:hypothetical protein
MKILDFIFGKNKQTESHNSKHTENDLRNIEFKISHEKAKKLFLSTLELYYSKYCQCAYPRFQQMIRIDLRNYKKGSFKCYDTDLLIDLSKKYFDIDQSQLNDEITNQIWTCKKCGSIYEYGWSDFSIYVERQKLKLIELKTNSIGRETKKPIPVFLGLMGHSYPDKTEIKNVEFEEFENYMTEK